MDIAQPEGVKLGGLVVPARVVHLVGHHIDRLGAAAQQIGDLVVQVGDAGRDVHHEKDDRCLLDGNMSLTPDGLLEDVVRPVHKPARIDYGERLPLMLSTRQ